MNTAARPRVLLLADERGWAFDTNAQAIRGNLDHSFDCDILYKHEHPEIDSSRYDLIHIFYEQEVYHRPYLKNRVKLIKNVTSHEWQYQGKSVDELYEESLKEADLITVPNMKLFHLLKDIPKPVRLYATGVNVERFVKKDTRTGPLVVGWAGNPHVHEYLKNLPMLQAACRGICELKIADGTLPREQMPDFYNSIDVIVCSSRAEGDPNTLLEGMASGCFPVSFDVGIAAQLIENNLNGILIPDVDAQLLRSALHWCSLNVDTVRAAWKMNVEKIRALRDERVTAQRIGDIYKEVLSYV